MLYGLYLSAAGVQLQEYRQDVISNNLANAQTVGFKRDLAEAQARLNPTKEDIEMGSFRGTLGAQQGGGVWAAPTTTDFSQGILKKTDSPFDMALNGQGFLTVQGANGQQLLTRDGRFAVGVAGNLVTASSGQAILGTDGQPIKLDPDLPTQISTTGDITQDGTVVGTLAMVKVGKNSDVEKVGNSMFRTKANAKVTPATDTEVRQGYVEESGVDPMTEMVDMMEGQRIFDANTKMISYQDTTLQLLNTVGRVA